MAKLPNPLKIPPKDFIQLTGLDRLILPLNKFAQDVLLLFDKRLTVQDNMDGAILTVIVDGTYPVSVPWTRQNPPALLMIGQCLETVGAHVPLDSSLTLDWSYDGIGHIKINNVLGLTATKNNTFTLTLLGLVG